MKVLLVNKAYYPHIGGVEKHVQDVAEALKRFTDVDASVMVASEGLRGRRDSVNGVAVTRLANLGTLRSTPLAPSFIWRLGRERADIYHFHFPYPVAEAAYLLARNPGRLVVTYHSDIVRQRRLLRLYHPFLTRFLDDAEVILASSPNLISSSPYLRLYSGKCRVIPFAIDVDKFAARGSVLEEAAAARERYAGQKPMVLFVGRLVYYKGLEYLIDAMSEVDAVLVIVGEGELYSELTAKIRVLGLGGRIKFTGWLGEKDLVSMYHACDLLVLPSVARSEAFGFVQLEAHACGKPVVSTNLPTGVPYANLDGVTGLIVPPANSGALSWAIKKLLTNPNFRHKLGEAAKRRVESQFTYEHMAQELVAVYEEVLETRKS